MQTDRIAALLSPSPFDLYRELAALAACLDGDERSAHLAYLAVEYARELRTGSL